jgi:hypothetical protein
VRVTATGTVHLGTIAPAEDIADREVVGHRRLGESRGGKIVADFASILLRRPPRISPRIACVIVGCC